MQTKQEKLMSFSKTCRSRTETWDVDMLKCYFQLYSQLETWFRGGGLLGINTYFSYILGAVLDDISCSAILMMPMTTQTSGRVQK
jgi:hypothetical protein